MKKYFVILLAMALVGLSSCHKTRYCKCTTIINEEVVEVGQPDEYYLIEDGRESCAEKSKEIQGWGQVTCNEVSESEVTGVEHHWWDDIFGNSNNHNNNNNGGHGKP